MCFGKVRFLLEGGLGRGIFDFFGEKCRGPPTPQNGMMHDPSQIPTQKHLTLPPPPSPSSNNRHRILILYQNPARKQY